MIINMKRYLLGLVITGVLVFALAQLLGGALIDWLVSVKVQVSFLGVIANLVLDPLIWILENPALGALLSAVFWPVFLILLALLFLVLVVGLGWDAVNAVDRQLR